MTDKEEAAMVAAAEHNGTLRDQAILILMLHTGLRTMEVCNLSPRDINIGKRSGLLIVRAGKRNKQREAHLNSTCRAILEKYMPELPPDSPTYSFQKKPVIGLVNEP